MVRGKPNGGEEWLGRRLEGDNLQEMEVVLHSTCPFVCVQLERLCVRTSGLPLCQFTQEKIMLEVKRRKAK